MKNVCAFNEGEDRGSLVIRRDGMAGRSQIHCQSHSQA